MTREMVSMFEQVSKATSVKIDDKDVRTLKQFVNSASEWQTNVILILCIRSAFSIIWSITLTFNPANTLSSDGVGMDYIQLED